MATICNVKRFNSSYSDTYFWLNVDDVGLRQEIMRSDNRTLPYVDKRLDKIVCSIFLQNRSYFSHRNLTFLANEIKYRF